MIPRLFLKKILIQVIKGSRLCPLVLQHIHILSFASETAYGVARS